MIPTLFLIGVVVFVIVRLLPGDSVSAMLGDRATEEAIQRLTRQLGLDQSIFAQFVAFLEAVARGELGTSLAFRVPVTTLIAERLPVTLILTALAAVLAILLAVPLAFVAALNANRWPDLVIRAVFQVGLSSPVFFVGLVLLTVFAAWLRLFPVGGYGDGLPRQPLPSVPAGADARPEPRRRADAQPAGVDPRGAGAEYVDFARAKGLATRVILVRHVMRNALISTVTLFGLHIGQLLGGAVITETVFAIPGVGRLMIDSIYGRDYPVIQGLTLVLAVLVSLVFLVTDIVQMWLDPRVGR